MDDLKTRLLKHFGLEEGDFARLSREPSFSFLPRMDDDLAPIAAKKRILAAMEHNEKVLIYGDYDTDGIMATSILTRCFRYYGKSVSFFIPSRYLDGYGLTMDNAKKIADKGYHLVILVDNGVSCLQEVSYLLSRGVETIIIDHHELPSTLPPSLATIHQDLLPYGDYPVSAGYLSFIFSIFLLGRVDEYLLTLGALSTISDCMPLFGHNRDIVALALRAIRKNKYPEILMLAERNLVDESTLAMSVIPTINAVGRMVEDHTLNRLVHYFADLDPKDKQRYATWAKEINAARKDATKAAVDRLRIEPSLPAITVIGYLKEGLNGLLANRLLGEYRKPIAVFSKAKADPSVYVGSIRADEGFNVMDFQRSISSILVRGGGHAHAGGVSVKKEDYGAFKDAFEKYAFRHPLTEKAVDKVPLLLSEVNMDSYRLLRLFGPFGHEYPAPTFEIASLPLSSLQWSYDHKRLSTPLSNGVRLFAFDFPKPDYIDPNDKVTLTGQLQLEEYKGQVTLNFRVSEHKIQRGRNF